MSDLSPSTTRLLCLPEPDLSDVVATQSASLKPCYPTPVHWRTVTPGSHNLLSNKLAILKDALEYRYLKYGKEAAEEYCLGHTLTELRIQYHANVQRQLGAWFERSPSPVTYPSPKNPPNGALTAEDRLSASNSTQP
ncbi:hypothetical protein VTI74DRAFT_6413 [Chaetomium olivicolor]